MKRIIGLLLLTLMMVTYMPTMSFAEAVALEGTCGTCNWEIKNGILTISGGTMADWGDYPPWFDALDRLGTSVTVGRVNITGPIVLKTCRRMFCGKFRYAIDIDLSYLDTSNVTDMSSMFNGCETLGQLDVSNLDTSNVTDMSYMFCGCDKLTQLDLSSFNTSNVRDMSGMFCGCYYMKQLNLESFQTGNVEDMGSLFKGCSALESINISNFDTSKVTNMAAMFSECKKLKNIDVSNFDTSRVTNMYAMFNECNNIRNIDLSNFDTSKVTTMGWMFRCCFLASNIDVSSFDTSNVTDMSEMFIDIHNYLTKLDLSNFNTSKVTNMFGMFAGLDNLTTLNINSFDTSNVKDMTGMFAGCEAIEELDLSSFDTSNVTIMSNMFNNCDYLQILKTGIWIYSDQLQKDGKYPTFPVKMKNIASGSVYSAGSNIPEIINTTYERTDEEQGIPDAKLYENITGTINKTGSIKFVFDETAFDKDSSVYNHTLGRAAIALSLMAYNDDKSILENVLVDQMGFMNPHTWNDVMEDDEGTKSPYMIAHKKVMLDGEETELVVVVLRGSFNAEWMDNFDVGIGKVHEGFNRAKDFIIDDIRKYIDDEKNGFNKNAKMKMLVTGHSRGAAVANLIGKDLDDGIINPDKLSANDVFVFTFATPNTVVLSDSEKESYNNIFNIVNPEDFVTKVVPSAWGYGRYGITYVLPSITTETINSNSHIKYSEYLKDIKRISQELCAKQLYQPYSSGEIRLSMYIKKVAILVNDIEEYYKKDLYTQKRGDGNSEWSLHDLYKYFLGGHESNIKYYENLSNDYIKKAASGFFGFVGLSTLDFFIVDQVINPEFECAHVAETYYAGMNSLSKYELTLPRHVLVGEANCPVDVTIKDADGNIVGQIVNNKVQEPTTVEDSGVIMMVEGESKQFSIPGAGDFTIELAGNNNGTVDYTLREEDADTGEIQRVYYQEIPVTPSTTLTQTIEGEPELTDIKLIDVDTSEVIEPDAVLENNGIGELSAEVTVEGKGSAASMYNLNPGDYITLEAITDECNEFLGWYDKDGQLISRDAKYGISMKESIELTAKFTANEPQADPCADGHTFSSWKTTKKATELASGKKTRKCSVCGKTETKTIAALKPTLPAVKITTPKAAKKAATIKWKKVSSKNQKKIAKIQIQYSTDKNFKKGVKTVYAKKSATSKKITKLTSKKTYYVRIRAYKSSGGVVHVSKWSKTQNVKAK